MLRSMVGYFRRNVVGFLALFVALGGTAYAVNTVSSTDIVDGQVKSVDIGNGEVNSADVKDQSLTTFDVSTFLGADIVDGSLTSADVAPGTFVGGRGQLLSNRIVFTPSATRTLLTVPGLGTVTATCLDAAAVAYWTNDTGGPVDIWRDLDTPGKSSGTVLTANFSIPIVVSDHTAPSDYSMSSTVSVGAGNDPGPRKVATIHVSALQTAINNPCGFQAQGTLWTSP